MLRLIVNILEQKGLVEPGQRVTCGLEPSSRMQQVKRIGTQRARRELAKSLSVEKVVGPGDLALAMQQTIRRSAD